MGIFSKWFSSKKQQDGTISVTPQMPQFSAVDYCEQGQKMLNEGKLMQAMEFFQAAIEEVKHFEKAYLLLSEVYEKQGKMDKAKAALYALLAVEPNNKNALGRIDELNGKQVIIIPPISQKPPVKPKSVSLSTKQPKIKQKTKAGEISYKVTKYFWILLCLTIILLSFVLAIVYSIYEDVDDGLVLGLIIFVDFVILYIVFEVLYLLLYCRDNWKGDKYGNNHNPIVYNLFRNIIYSVFLLAATIALICWGINTIRDF